MAKLFISIGKDQFFFTLRETYVHEFYIGGKRFTETRSFHHFNLSQNADEAWSKANEASERFGLPLSGSRENLTEEMDKITRATAEQLAERERQRIAWEEDRKAQRDAELARKIDMINSGVFAFGPHCGVKFVECPDVTYLEWYVNKRDDFEADSLPRLTADAIFRFAADRLPPKPDARATVGVVGERIDVPVTVLRVVRFFRDSFSGYGQEACYITTMVTDDRVCVVVRSGAFNPDVGDSFKLRGTVKSHELYKGQMQTVLQRVKVL
jgi:hypothetical protein